MKTAALNDYTEKYNSAVLQYQGIIHYKFFEYYKISFGEISLAKPPENYYKPRN
jgi:hypothetical protein